LARTGYSHEISSGQRKYGGPPPDWTPSSEQAAESQSGEAEMVTEEVSVEVQLDRAQLIEYGVIIKDFYLDSADSLLYIIFNTYNIKRITKNLEFRI
jgi:hypothetical protein